MVQGARSPLSSSDDLTGIHRQTGEILHQIGLDLERLKATRAQLSRAMMSLRQTSRPFPATVLLKEEGHQWPLPNRSSRSGALSVSHLPSFTLLRNHRHLLSV